MSLGSELWKVELLRIVEDLGFVTCGRTGCRQAAIVLLTWYRRAGWDSARH